MEFFFIFPPYPSTGLRTSGSKDSFPVAFLPKNYLGFLLVTLLIGQQCFSITPDAQQALNYFEHIKGDPTTVANKFYRAVMLCELHEYAFALQLYNELLQLMPNSSQLMYNKAYVYKMIGNFNDALSLYQKVLQQDPMHQTAHIGLSHVLLHLGNYQEGFKELEWRLVTKEIRQKNPIDLELIKNKKIVIYCESGIGDQIQCIRYAEILKKHGAYVIAQTYDALIPLMQHCPFVDEVTPQNKKNIDADFVFCYFSLPLVCNTISEQSIPKTIPYFNIEPKLINQWKSKLSADKKFKIGLSWHCKNNDASFEYSPYRKRSVPLKLWSSLAELSNTSFYSLQRITGLDELKDLPPYFKITTFDGDFDDTHGRFMDTAAVMYNLDLLITVDTAVAHLAGALGIRTWLILPAVPDWRWQQNRTDSPWYPSMRLFRQQHVGSWEEVIKEIKQSLEQLIQGQSR